jgi:hypothetical protein
VRSTTADMMRLTGLVLAIFFYLSADAQENSPYSRYGLGDLVPSQNILNRSMGGIAAGYSDFQTVNFVNPASYGNYSFSKNPSFIRNTIFDIGIEVDNRKLKSTSTTDKFSATNLIVSYVQLGLPIKMKKANKKGIFLGMNFGLRPISRINYKIFKTERLQGIDSLLTVYEGNGGVNEANAGFGLRIKNFNIGFDGGYRFGNKNYSTGLSFLNDTVVYYQSNSANRTNFNGVFLRGGMQYELSFKSKYDSSKTKGTLRLGAYGNLKRNLSASQDVVRETINYNADGEVFRVDSVYENNVKGKITYPAVLGFGFTYQDSASHWLFGADYETQLWSGYRYYGAKDQLQNSWKIRAGAEYLPASGSTSTRKYFNFVRYRAGFYYGPDYINTGSSLPEFGFTFGAGFPLKLRRGFYESQSSLMNVGFEIGRRGNNRNAVKESVFRISVGFALSDIWFNRYRYQ